MSVKKWVKIGAICECSGEGTGNLWEVKNIDLLHDSVWLEALSGHNQYQAGYPIGWKALKGCTQTPACRKVEATMPRKTPSKKSANRVGCHKSPVTADVLDHALRTLGGQWGETVKLLQFQLQATDERGLPANIHLLDTLRQALTLYAQLAAWAHVDARIKGKVP